MRAPLLLPAVLAVALATSVVPEPSGLATRRRRRSLALGETVAHVATAAPICPRHGAALSTADLRLALSLGRSFMLQSQRPRGDFHYQYDWRRGVDDEEGGNAGGVSAVREAGAVWGLALMVLDETEANGTAPADLLGGLRRSLDFFESHSKDVEGDGRRVVLYPGLEDVPGDTGTLAVLALAYVDYLRSTAPSADERASRSQSLQRLLRSIAASVMDGGHSGRVHKHYRLTDGSFVDGHTPYYDGEVLLALTKAAKYLSFAEYWPLIKRMAASGWQKNVQQGLSHGRDDKVMKGYYQWASMAWHELLTSDHAEDFAAFRHRLVDYGLWLVKVHRLSKRTRNTGYAFEGLVPAYAMARELGRSKGQMTLGCAIVKGLRKVSGMQLGHPLADGSAREAPPDKRTRGGVQNSLTEPLLRIDTTQHQMHGIILARRLLEGQMLV